MSRMGLPHSYEDCAFKQEIAPAPSALQKCRRFTSYSEFFAARCYHIHCHLWHVHFVSDPIHGISVDWDRQHGRDDPMERELDGCAYRGTHALRLARGFQ
jgi:hypothetical protein